MADPFVMPEQTKPRGATSAPIAKIAPVGDLIPGVDDIPYIEADFAMYDVIERVEDTVRGPEKKVEEKGGLYHAVCTFWEPSAEERMILAAGGAIQVLNFSDKQPIMAVTAAWIGPPEMPRQAVSHAVARAMYEEGHPVLRWDALPEAERQLWLRRAHVATRIVTHWAGE